MRILLLGAGGFIGRAVLAELAAHGHRVTAVVRPGGGGAIPHGIAVREIDLARAVREEDWREALRDIEIVVNSAGILQGRAMEAVHVAMPRALHAAAREAGVARVVLISAISARPEVASDYAQSKLAGEQALRASGLGWTVLRPSLIYGEGSYGGTSLLRGLAALPWFVPLAGSGDYAFTPIHLRDLARTVRTVCESQGFTGQTLEPVGPETLTLRELLARYRRWLGFGEARCVSVPLPLMRLLARIGDVTGGGPVATNSLVQLVAGNAGDSASFARAAGFRPRSLDEALTYSPAQVQDRWHARLFFLAPALRAVLIVLWLASALLGLMFAREQAAAVTAGLGLPATLAEPLRIGTSLLDLAIAALLLTGRWPGMTTALQFLTVAGYTLAMGLAAPALWLDPLGPLLKNLPILAAILVHGAVAQRR